MVERETIYGGRAVANRKPDLLALFQVGHLVLLRVTARVWVGVCVRASVCLLACLLAYNHAGLSLTNSATILQQVPRFVSSYDCR